MLMVATTVTMTATILNFEDNDYEYKDDSVSTTFKINYFLQNYSRGM